MLCGMPLEWVRHPEVHSRVLAGPSGKANPYPEEGPVLKEVSAALFLWQYPNVITLCSWIFPPWE